MQTNIIPFLIMTIKDRKKSLKILGDFLSQFRLNKIKKKNHIPHNDIFFEALKKIIDRSQEQNPWFTKKNMLFAIQTWADALKEEKIEKWFSQYHFPEISSIKTVGVVMAGNIPLVGFHDFISVLMSGHRVKAKLSSNDKYLLPLLAKYLEYLSPEFKSKIEFADGVLSDVDAIIATGSDNTSRYFDYYFGKYLHIIRKNRNSVAVLTGDETQEDLDALADDMMIYFGLGCRNVSKLFVPKDYDFDRIFSALMKYENLINYKKYANNYDYNKAVYLMSTDKEERESLIDNGLVLLKEDVHYASPIGTIFFEKYEHLNDVKKILKNDVEKIQVVVSKADISNAIPFGQTQIPQLWDYADGVDTMSFLLSL